MKCCVNNVAAVDGKLQVWGPNGNALLAADPNGPKTCTFNAQWVVDERSESLTWKGRPKVVDERSESLTWKGRPKVVDEMLRRSRDHRASLIVVVDVVVVAAAACTTGDVAQPHAFSPNETGGPSASPSVFFASGTRLRARTWESPPAHVRVLRDFFDTARNEVCSFARDGGNVWNVAASSSSSSSSYYCLPPTLAQHQIDSGPYGDVECTVPLALAPSADAGEVAAYGIKVPVDSCASSFSISHVGPVTTTNPYVRTDTGECRRAGAQIPVQVFKEDVPLNAFVRGDERVIDSAGAGTSTGTGTGTGTGGSRIASLVIAAEDGASQTIGAFDHQRNEPVRFEDLGDDVNGRSAPARWVPARVAFQGAGEVLYGDDQCAKAIPTKIARNTICPLTAARVFLDECGHANVFSIGAPVDRTRLRAFDETSVCRPVTAKGVLAFELGVDVSADLAPAYVHDRGGGGGGAGGSLLEQREYSGPNSGGQTVMAAPGLILGTTGEPCGPALAIDGAVRCLPQRASAFSQFADDACTSHALLEPRNACARTIGPVAPARFVRVTLEGETGARVFERREAVSTAYAQKSDQCVQSALIDLSTTYATQEVDVALFPVMIEKTD